MPVPVGFGVAEEAVVLLDVREGFLQRCGHAGSVINEPMLHLRGQVVQFLHVGLKDQNG